MPFVTVSQICAADILDMCTDIDKMPNKCKSLGKKVDLTSTAMILISTVKREKEKCREIQEGNC